MGRVYINPLQDQQAASTTAQDTNEHRILHDGADINTDVTPEAFVQTPNFDCVHSLLFLPNKTGNSGSAGSR
jgi:hypothetical protein